MKISSLFISNFRGIKEVNLADLGNLVVIAGPNGSGKSCVFDAIRLLKSVYGGYQQNEWQQWMGEFQIRLTNKASDFVSMFNDRSKELRIRAAFRIADDEREYIQSNMDELLKETIWRTLLPQAYELGGYRMEAFAHHFREREAEVASKVNEHKAILARELESETITGECFISVGGIPQIVNSTALSIIFSTFQPHKIGVIDYHGAQRHYGREYVQGINLNLEAKEQEKKTTALYNYGAKYNNVKSEMAASYIKEILAEQAGIPRAKQSSLTNTLKELFKTFFPDKEFLGPQPTTDGALEFPVKTASGSVHDLDELSAGEKEILYGYLRIRNSAPRNSIILLDEPELHLNPRLIRGLPQFYNKYLGEALSNQIWLVSHSDALLREVVGRRSFNVFHMIPAGQAKDGEPQLRQLSVTADLELALVDLVGDIAAYRPSGKVVIFEGGGDSDFDQKVTSRFFPDIQAHANLVSGSNKVRVKALHEILQRASERGQLPFKFFAICDRDSIIEPENEALNTFSWDVYHIENYLIEPNAILAVLESLGIANLPTIEALNDELRECAKECIPSLLRHELSEYANGALISEINLGTDPKAENAANVLYAAISKSAERVSGTVTSKLSKENLVEQQRLLLEGYEASIADGTWASRLPGRDILKRFSGKRCPKISYEVFRNLLVSRIAESGHQPEGMKKVIEKILDA